MGFLSPFLLASAAALAVPLWLHLRRRRRQNPLEFPSLRYLRTAAARMKRQARVEDLGLLLLRLLLLALLAMAFARPVIRSSGKNWLGARRAVESVIVIDATASMGWRGESGSRIDQAKRLAREWIDGLDRSDAVALWVLTDHLERPVPLPVTDRAHVHAQLDTLQASEGTSSLAPVFEAAREWAEARGAGRRELVVITDNQHAAWDWPASGFFNSRWKSGTAGLVVLTPDSAEASNATVDSVTWNRAVAGEGEVLEGVVKLANHGPSAVKDLLECRLDGRTLQRLPVEIPAGGSTDVPVSLPVAGISGPVLAGDVSLAGDALSCDDRWNFALPVRKRSVSLVVDRDDPLTGAMVPSHFLTRALAAGAAGKASVVSSAVFKEHPLEGSDALWFTAGAVRNGADWARALDFTSRGGTVVVTAESQPDPALPGWPVEPGGETPLPPGRMATRLLAASHPLFDGVWSERVPFPPLPQRMARQCGPASGAKVIASLAGEYPLLVEQPKGRGRILWINASLDRSWGDLPLSPVYVALVQQMARAGELAKRAATSAWVGEAWPDLASVDPGAAWPVDPDAGASPRVLRSGLFDALDNSGAPAWRCAVNVRRSESDLRPESAAVLQAMLPGKVAAGSTGLRDWREANRRDVPLWPWLLAAAAICYLLEWRLSSLAAVRREPSVGKPASVRMERRQPA